MAERGDVLASKRRLGFGTGGGTERFVVVQADALNEVLETTLAVPLDTAHAYYSDYPGAVLVKAAEIGASRDQVAVVTALGSVDLSRFEPTAVARLAPATLDEIDRMLAIVLSL